MPTYTNTRRGKRLGSPAALALATTGVTQRAVAELYGVTPRAVGFWLDGTVSSPPNLEQALGDLLAADDVQRVMDLIP